MLPSLRFTHHFPAHHDKDWRYFDPHLEFPGVPDLDQVQNFIAWANLNDDDNSKRSKLIPEPESVPEDVKDRWPVWYASHLLEAILDGVAEGLPKWAGRLVTAGIVPSTRHQRRVWERAGINWPIPLTQETRYRDDRYFVGAARPTVSPSEHSDDADSKLDNQSTTEETLSEYSEPELDKQRSEEQLYNRFGLASGPGPEFWRSLSSKRRKQTPQKVEVKMASNKAQSKDKKHNAGSRTRKDRQANVAPDEPTSGWGLQAKKGRIPKEWKLQKGHRWWHPDTDESEWSSSKDDWKDWQVYSVRLHTTKDNLEDRTWMPPPNVILDDSAMFVATFLVQEKMRYGYWPANFDSDGYPRIARDCYGDPPKATVLVRRVPQKAENLDADRLREVPMVWVIRDTYQLVFRKYCVLRGQGQECKVANSGKLRQEAKKLPSDWYLLPEHKFPRSAIVQRNGPEIDVTEIHFNITQLASPECPKYYATITNDRWPCNKLHRWFGLMRTRSQMPICLDTEVVDDQDKHADENDDKLFAIEKGKKVPDKEKRVYKRAVARQMYEGIQPSEKDDEQKASSAKAEVSENMDEVVDKDDTRKNESEDSKQSVEAQADKAHEKKLAALRAARKGKSKELETNPVTTIMAWDDIEYADDQPSASVPGTPTQSTVPPLVEHETSSLDRRTLSKQGLASGGLSLGQGTGLGERTRSHSQVSADSDQSPFAKRQKTAFSLSKTLQSSRGQSQPGSSIVQAQKIAEALTLAPLRDSQTILHDQKSSSAIAAELTRMRDEFLSLAKAKELEAQYLRTQAFTLSKICDTFAETQPLEELPEVSRTLARTATAHFPTLKGTLSDQIDHFQKQHRNMGYSSALVQAYEDDESAANPWHPVMSSVDESRPDYDEADELNITQGGSEGAVLAAGNDESSIKDEDIVAEDRLDVSDEEDS